MSRKTIIFGNGLGMALDPAFFSLDAAIGRVWDDGGIIDEAQKKLIRACLPDRCEDGRPNDESDLELLQRVLSSCDFLNSVGDPADVHWLSDMGKDFPAAIRKFIHGVACSFHVDEKKLPDVFLESLCAFIRDSRSHVATLNYDRLLYDGFNSKKVCDGYGGSLIDGFWGTGFAAENLERKYDRRLGWYLHLHGSPLFYDEEGAGHPQKPNDFGLAF
ncbi:hypothetical protein [Roseibium sediminis]|uniref:hypothetical protein n=1 Tax=Roseibium sediminis TaxID=1775174 RepID=UPI00123D7E01|nr:hypothetical protein [Roseibium sediminis]